MRRREFLGAGLAATAAWLAGGTARGESREQSLTLNDLQDVVLSGTKGDVRFVDLLNRPGKRGAIVFFGFANCEVICQTGLQDISTWMQGNPALARQYTIAFVSLDPRRDTPALAQAFADKQIPNGEAFALYIDINSASQRASLLKLVGAFHVEARYVFPPDNAIINIARIFQNPSLIDRNRHPIVMGGVTIGDYLIEHPGMSYVVRDGQVQPALPQNLGTILGRQRTSVESSPRVAACG